MSELHADLIPWLEEGLPINCGLDKESKGFRDLMWCPYLNEPAIIKYKDGKPDCPNCDGSFEAETHLFMGHIRKPIG